MPSGGIKFIGIIVKIGRLFKKVKLGDYSCTDVMILKTLRVVVVGRKVGHEHTSACVYHMLVMYSMCTNIRVLVYIK